MSTEVDRRGFLAAIPVIGAAGALAALSPMPVNLFVTTGPSVARWYDPDTGWNECSPGNLRLLKVEDRITIDGVYIPFNADSFA